MLEKLKEFLGGTKREMPPPAQVSNEFVRHLKRGDKMFQLDLGSASLNILWDDALRIEPRLIYTVASFKAQSRGAYHDVSVIYWPNRSVRIEDIIVMRADAPIDILRTTLEKMPEEIYLVVNDSDVMGINLSSLMNSSDIPQFVGYNGVPFEYLKNSADWCCFRVELSYDMTRINETNNRHALEVEMSRIESLLHMKNLLPEIKVFLALSYIAQETEFSLDGGISAYSALCEKKASAKGFAEGYMELLKYVGVTSYVLEGRNNAIPGVEYAWTLVRLQGDWYHVDPAVALQGSQLYLGAFLCSNSVMRRDYTWSEQVDATGFLFDANQVLDTVRASSQMLLSMGIPSKYVNPSIEE